MSPDLKIKMISFGFLLTSVKAYIQGDECRRTIYPLIRVLTI